MKKKHLIIMITLIVLSLLLKGLITYGVADGDSYLLYEKIIIMTPEHFVYAVDFAAALLTFELIARKIRPLWGKILLALGNILVYFVSLLLCNYFWQTLEWYETAGEYILNFEQVFIQGMREYIATGKPMYHLVLIGMIIALAAVIVLTHYRGHVSLMIARYFAVKAAEAKTEDVEIFYMDIIFKHFNDSLIYINYEAMKARYIDIMMKAQSASLDTKFDELEEHITKAYTKKVK